MLVMFRNLNDKYVDRPTETRVGCRLESEIQNLCSQLTPLTPTQPIGIKCSSYLASCLCHSWHGISRTLANPDIFSCYKAITACFMGVNCESYLYQDFEKFLYTPRSLRYNGFSKSVVQNNDVPTPRPHVINNLSSISDKKIR